MAPKPKEKPKPPSSSPLPSTVALEDLFSTLNRHIQASEYDTAVKVADQVLAIAPGDEDALRCKIVALIKSDDIDRALSVIQASEKLPIDLRFYKAYCLYRQNRLPEALESLKDEERNSSVLQLESQILYRLGRMDACMESYEKLRKFKIESLDLKTNIIAALISSGRAFEVQGMMDVLKVTPTSSFDLAYNIACSLIEMKKYADAEKQLLSARRVGQETLMDDDYTEEEIENELAPIAAQLAYVQHLMGRPQEAIAAYTEIVNRNLADASSMVVVTNNLIALKGGKDVSDGLRKLDRFIVKGGGQQHFQLAHGLDYKLSLRQKEAIYANRLLLLLHANRMDQARELAGSLSDMFPENVMPVLLQAVVLVRENKAARAEDILFQFAERFPGKSKLVLLARAQIAAAANHLQIAVESLARVPEIQHMPATVATLVSLKEQVGDIDGAGAVLSAAIQHWSNSMVGEDNLYLLMHEAAAFKLKHGNLEEAARVYEELVKTRGSVEARVGLVTTAAHVDIEKAEAYAKELKKLPGLKGIDVESLEKTSGAKHVEVGNVASIEDTYGDGKGKARERKKRKRKPKYPKGFDPANPGPPPDPERWLPKRERSSYRPKRKDKRAAQVRGSQGSVSREKHEAANTGATITTSSKSGQVAASSSSSKPSPGNSNSEQAKTSSKSRKKSRS